MKFQINPFMLIVFGALLALMILVLSSCEQPNVPTKKSTHRIGKLGREIDIVEIEGCEYFFAEYTSFSMLEHKGNCKNPIHNSK